jgi:hypothetical protein
LLRASVNPQHALEFLRTLVALAPVANSAVSLKEEALKALKQGLGEVASSFVLLLTNLSAAPLFAGGAPEKEVEAWTKARAHSLAGEEALLLLKRLAPGEAEEWWRQAVSRALATMLAQPTPPWAKAAVLWLALPGVGELLRDLLPTTAEVESRLLGATTDLGLQGAALEQVRQRAVERRWSRLHAWAAMHSLPPHEALRMQRTFPGDPSPGLEMLVGDLPGTAVIDEAISRPDASLTGLVARRTMREPALLRQLDASNMAWRALWAAHVAAGGSPWPPEANRDVLGRALLDAVLGGDEPKALVGVLAEGLADTALRHPQRAALWDRLSFSGRATLLPHVVEALIKLCDAGQVVPAPEAPLVDAIVSLARRKYPSARLFAALLQWEVRLDEQEVIRWLNGPRREDWVPIAEGLGRSVRARGWKNAAKDIYNRCLLTPELRPAAEACQELLPAFDRWWLAWSGPRGETTPLDDAPLGQRVAELGASLAPERLDDLWELAGGERRHLSIWGTPDVRWRDAAARAQRGALEGGLLELVRVLRVDWPHNEDLRNLEQLISRVQHRTR